ncbi:hypothetical protein I4U23_030114 [Adineta vaga]|nr:hypothetical protein I4U23_030114 [Adineta vaga]
MTSFDRTVLYFFTVYFLGIYQTINCVEITSSFSPLNVSSSTEILKHTTDIHTSVEITSTTVSSSTSSSTTISTTINTSVYSSITSTITIITSSFLPQAPSGPGWWLFIALVITIIIVIIAGVIFYHRQQSPYRR